MGLTDDVIKKNFYGSEPPTQIALAGIRYQDTKNLILWQQNQAPFGGKWIVLKKGYLPPLSTVLSDSSDTIPGYLNEKVDGVTIQVIGNKLVATGAGNLWKNNVILSPLPDGIVTSFTVPDTFESGTLEICYRGLMLQPTVQFSEKVLLNGCDIVGFTPDKVADGGWLLGRYKLSLT